MKVNFDTKLLALDGVTHIKDEKGEETTLKSVSINALMLPMQDEKDLSGEEKLKRFSLALMLQPGGTVELNVEQLALIKKLIGKIYTQLVVGRAWPLLDPPATKE